MPAPPSSTLASRTALVTGASRGIGRAIAQVLAGAGARVIASARDEGALTEVVAGLPGDGHDVLAMDVTDAAAVARALDRQLTVDILVCNAGTSASAPFHKTSDELWDATLAVNATAPFRLCRALVPAMMERGWGRVVIVASNAGLSGYRYTAAYCAAKHAVIGMMRAVALEIAHTPVTINAVCPGWVDTQMADQAITRIAATTGRSPDEARKVLESMSPQKRLATAEEVARLTLMLCDDALRGVHGQAIALDGGQTMR
jgi:NAD(P)-dependent dehydrogenase (short-subunit alcohol dehydrogenase family)